MINDFFMKIDLLDGDGGCTTVDEYEIIFDKITIKLSDATCDWDGFGQIMRQLFKVK